MPKENDYSILIALVFFFASTSDETVSDSLFLPTNLQNSFKDRFLNIPEILNLNKILLFFINLV